MVILSDENVHLHNSSLLVSGTRFEPELLSRSCFACLGHVVRAHKINVGPLVIESN